MNQRFESSQQQMNQSFESSQQQMNQSFESINQGFETINQRFYALIKWSISTIIAIGALIVGTFGLF